MDLNELIEAVGSYTESVDVLLKAIIDDDRTAFLQAVAALGMRRTALDVATGKVMGVAA